MDWLLLGTVCFIIIGFTAIASQKKNMESLTTLTVKRNTRSKETQTTIIWWIAGTTIWGVISIVLVVSWFFVNF